MAMEKVVKLPNPDRDESIAWTQSTLYAQKDFPRYNPDDLIGRQGYRIYDKMMIDEQMKAVVKFKRDAITSRDFTFKFDTATTLSPDEQKLRQAVLNACIEQMDGSFPDSLNFVLRGMVHGFSITEKVTKFIEVNGKTYIGLEALLPKPVESFYFYTDDYGKLIKFEQQIDNRKQTLNIDKFIHYCHAPERDEWYGQSDLREAHRSWYSKDIILKLWNLYLERMAGGFVAVTPTGQTTLSQKEFNALSDAISNIKTTTSLILPSGYAIDVIHPGATDGFERAISFHNLAMAKALLVPNLLGVSETGQTGAYAQSQTQLEAFFWTLNADSRRLEACLNEQLFQPLCEANFADKQWPLFAFKSASQEYVKWVVQTWSGLIGAGAVRMTDQDEEHLRKILDMPALTEEDKAASPLPANQRLANETLQAQQPAGTPSEGKTASGEKKKFSYDPSQPRAPAGVSNGGQWIDAGTADTLVKQLIDKHGFTYIPAMHGSPSEGFVVAMYQDRVSITDGTTPVTPDDIMRFADRNSDVLAQDPRNSIGAWLNTDNGKVYLDVSRVYNDRNEAMHEAENRMEEAIYDLAKGESIWTPAADQSRRAYLTRQDDPAAIPAGSDAAGDSGRHQQGAYTVLQPKELKIIPHGGKLYTASIAAFNRAVQRVAFAVIDRKTEAEAQAGAEAMSAATAAAVRNVLTDERIAAAIADPTLVEHLRFAGDDVAKIKSACKATLHYAYLMGTQHAVSEIAQAKGEAAQFEAVRDMATQYLEANGARMAGNIADGARSIIQQDLINAVKYGWSPQQTRDATYRRLVERGFATVRDLFPEGPPEGFDKITLPTYLMTLARTNIFEAMNEARFSWFTDPRQQGYVVALEYSAILDDRTTQICKDLDGFTRATDDPAWDEYRPPNHWNCRSVLIPITLADKWGGEESPNPQ